MSSAIEILSSPVLARVMFYPRKHPVSKPFWVRSDGARLCCYYDEKLKGAPLIVFFHGNGETVGDYAWEFPNIMEVMGCNILLAEYRGYGESDGIPNLYNFLADACAIVKTLPSHADKIVLFGRSLGCLQAVHAAGLLPNAAGLILESGVANIATYIANVVQEFLPGMSLERALLDEGLRCSINAVFDQKSKLHRFQGRGLVICASGDTLVHESESRRLYNWLGGPKVLHMFDAGGHNSVFSSNVLAYCDLIADLIGPGRRWRWTAQDDARWETTSLGEDKRSGKEA